MQRMKFKRSKSLNVWQGIALGAAGGLLGAWVMNQSQAAMSKIMPAEKPAAPKDGQQDGQQEPATVVAAEKVSEATLHAPLPEDHKRAAEPLVHYGFGALVGALYGGLSAVAPAITLGLGTLYGAAVWLLADEIAVPALGLSKGPMETPLPKHLEALGAHLVYGLTTEGIRLAGEKLATLA